MLIRGGGGTGAGWKNRRIGMEGLWNAGEERKNEGEKWEKKVEIKQKC